jgi:hypothetical protein
MPNQHEDPGPIEKGSFLYEWQTGIWRSGRVYTGEIRPLRERLHELLHYTKHLVLHGGLGGFQFAFSSRAVFIANAYDNKNLIGNGSRLALYPAVYEWGRAEFDWGQEGANAAFLAKSILAHHLDDYEGVVSRCSGEAERLQQKFMVEVIAKLPREGFRLSGTDVTAWCAKNGVDLPVAMPQAPYWDSSPRS